MSDLLSDLDFAPERETVKEPPKRWRNWYRALIGCWISGQHFRVGELIQATNVYPSKELAENRAVNPKRGSAVYAGAIVYLGAFPDGEAP